MTSGTFPQYRSLMSLFVPNFLGPTWKNCLSYALASLAVIVITHCSALTQFLMSNGYFTNCFIFFLVVSLNCNLAGQLHGGRGPKTSGKPPPPPPFRAMPERKRFFSCEVLPNRTSVFNQGRIFFLTKFSPNVLHVCGSPWWCSWPFDLLPQLLPPPFAALNSFLHLLYVCTAHFSNSPLKLGSPFRWLVRTWIALLWNRGSSTGIGTRFHIIGLGNLTKAWLAGITREVGLEPLDLASSSHAWKKCPNVRNGKDRLCIFHNVCTLHCGQRAMLTLMVNCKDLVGLTDGWLQISSLSQWPSSAADPT